MPSKAELTVLLATALAFTACKTSPNPQPDTSPAPRTPAVWVTPTPPDSGIIPSTETRLPQVDGTLLQIDPLFPEPSATRNPHHELLLPHSKTSRHNVLITNETQNAWLYSPSALQKYQKTFKYCPTRLIITDAPNAKLARNGDEGTIDARPDAQDQGVQLIALCLTAPDANPNAAIQNEAATIFYFAAMGLPDKYLQQFLLQPAPPKAVYNEYAHAFANVGSVFETSLSAAIEKVVSESKP